MHRLIVLLLLLPTGSNATVLSPAPRDWRPDGEPWSWSAHGPVSPERGVDRSTSGPHFPAGGPTWDDGWGVIITGPCEMAAYLNGDVTDTDGDGRVDACDTCPEDFDPSDADADGDGVGDACDTCPDVPDSDNVDSDGDGVGDVCEEE